MNVDRLLVGIHAIWMKIHVFLNVQPKPNFRFGIEYDEYERIDFQSPVLQVSGFIGNEIIVPCLITFSPSVAFN